MGEIPDPTGDPVLGFAEAAQRRLERGVLSDKPDHVSPG